MEFSYEIQKGQTIYDDPEARRKSLGKKIDGYRGFEKHRGIPHGKSTGQLGYYWGFLVPPISEELIRLGWTVTKKYEVGGEIRTREKLWDRGGDDKKYTDTHEFLKDEGARIGDEGEYVTLSEQDIEECTKFISNVLWICEHWLKMDVEKLEAKRPIKEPE